MMKRCLALAISFVFMASGCLLPSFRNDATFVWGGDSLIASAGYVYSDELSYGSYKYIHSKDDTYISITNSDRAATSVSIPAYIDELPVKEILSGAFEHCSDLSSVSLPDTITYIGQDAFSYCSSLKTIKLPSNLKTLRSYAFRNCKALQSITIPGSVEKIESETFSDCISLSSITISEGVKSITGTAFWETPITELHLPSSVESIGAYMAGCDQLKNVTVSDSNPYFTSVNGVLYTKDKKTLVVFPTGRTGAYSVVDGTEVIGPSAFAFTNITAVELPNSLTTLSMNSFYASNVKNIVVPPKVTTIPKSCFMHDKLVSITLPKGLTSIADSAFYCFREDAMKINYQGSSADWSAVSVGSGNFLEKSNLVYNYHEPSYDSASQGGAERITYSGLGMDIGDVFDLTVRGTPNDTIRVYFYYLDKDGNNSSSIVGALGGTIIDSSGSVTVTFNAPNAIDSLTVKVEYELSEPSLQYSIERNGTSTTTAATTSTKPTTLTSKTTTTTSSSSDRATSTSRMTVTTTTTTTTSQVTKKNGIIAGVDDYSFINDRSNFDPSYNISDVMKADLSKNSSNLAWDRIESKITGGQRWDGSCYGMSAVEILTKAGLLDVTTIDKDSSKLYDWAPAKDDANVEAIINYYHMLQYSNAFAAKANVFSKMTNRKQVDALIKQVLEVQDGGAPVLLCFNYSKVPNERLKAGHAVVAYGIEYGSWSYNDKYDCRILISDPNVLGFEDINCLYINTKTYYWEIPYYQTKYYSCSNHDQNRNDTPYAQLRFATNDLRLIDTFGYLRKEKPKDQDPIDSTIDIRSSTTDFNVAYYDADHPGGFSDSVCELLYYSDLWGLDSSDTISAVLPEADVPYEYYEKRYAGFETAMNYTNSSLRVKASNGSYSIFQPNASVSFEGKDSDFTLSMVLNEGYHPTDWYKISVRGENADSAELCLADDGYIIHGDSLSEGVWISASNRDQKACLGFATDLESAFIYEIDETTIGIKVDTDNDGIYETKFSPSYLGDVNNDMQVSVLDVVILQRYLLSVGSLSSRQCISADMDTDGSVDIFDLALLKRSLLHLTN